MHEPAVTQGFSAAANGSSGRCVPPYEEDKVPLVLLYSVVLAVGLPANLLTLYLTWLQVRRKNVLGVYLWSLSLCDLTYLCTLPLWALYVSGGHFWPWSSAACKLTGFVFFNNMYISIFLLCCVSCDRYVAVVYAVESRGLRGQRLAFGVTAAIVLVVALGHVPVFTMREGDAAEGERRCFEPGQSTGTVTAFNYARFAVGFLIPLVLLVFTNRAILSDVRRSGGLRPRQKRRVRHLAAAVVALFLLCFAPYHLILLLRAVTFTFPRLQGGACHFEDRIYTPYTVSLGLSTFNSAVNPLLYVLSSDNIRKELRRGVASLCCRDAGRSDSGRHKANDSSEAVPTDQEREKSVPTDQEREKSVPTDQEREKSVPTDREREESAR